MGTSTPEKEPSGRAQVSVRTVWPAEHVGALQDCRRVMGEEGADLAYQSCSEHCSKGLFGNAVYYLGPAGVLLLVSMATQHKPPVMSVARGGSLIGVLIPASPQNWPWAKFPHGLCILGLLLLCPLLAPVP